MLGLLACGYGELIRLIGVVGILLDRRGHLFHGGGGLFERGGLLFRAHRQIGVAGRDFLGATEHFERSVFHLRHDLQHVVGELVDPAAHAFEEALLAGEVDPLAQIAAVDGREHPLQLPLNSHFLRALGPLHYCP